MSKRELNIVSLAVNPEQNLINYTTTQLKELIPTSTCLIITTIPAITAPLC
jgi:hypothetical protein